MKKICILNRACMSSNYYQILNSCKGKYQIVRNLRDADWCIFPYCSCTDQNIDILEKELAECLKFKKKECKVIVTGCIFFVKEEKRNFLQKYDIDYLVPMDNQVNEICKILDVTPSNSVYNHYAVLGQVKIAEGCLNKCSFCRIHYSNRTLVSVPMQEIEKQVKDLVSRGIRFLRITALNTAQYGIDLYGKKMLPTLLQKLSKIAGVEGIEVFDCSLSDIDDDIANEIAFNDLITHVGIDIQSGSDPVLKSMNVGHDVKTIEKYFSIMKSKIRDTRIISGFPGETLKDVEATLKLLIDLDICKFHVCEYCDSKDTPSGKMQQLSPTLKHINTTTYQKVQKAMYAKKMLQDNGRKYIGYISGLSLKSVKVYCPTIGEINVDFKEQYLQLNLMDKVEILLENGKYLLVKVIECSLVKSVPPEESSNKLVDFLTNLNDMTTDFTLSISQLNDMVASIFFYHGGDTLNQEEFEENISTLPKVLKDALMLVYLNKK